MSKKTAVLFIPGYEPIKIDHNLINKLRQKSSKFDRKIGYAKHINFDENITIKQLKELPSNH